MKEGLQNGNRYSTLDCFGKAHVGRSIAVTLVNGRSESGRLTNVGMYDIELELPNGKSLIIMKHALVTVSIL